MLEDYEMPLDLQLSQSNFETIFYKKQGYAVIRNLALTCQLNTIGNRLQSWRVFLGIFQENSDISSWEQTIVQSRRAFAQLKSSTQIDGKGGDPLTHHSNNPWNQLYKDKDLKNEIQRDVDRTFQKNPFFRLEFVKKMMIEVLFIWAKAHPNISYRQGMNEILAFIVVVVYGERAHGNITIKEPSARVLRLLNDEDSIESDVYQLFDRIMIMGLADLNAPVENQELPNKKGRLLFLDPLNQRYQSEDLSASLVLRKCNLIFHVYLKAIDPQLYEHLDNEKIEPHLFLLRWLRCLCAREFTMSNVLILWDAIFASQAINIENNREDITGRIDKTREFVMLDFVSVAMIVFVRNHLVNADSASILQRLLKYPPVEDIGSLVDLSMKCRDFIFSGDINKKPNLPDFPFIEPPRKTEKQKKVEKKYSESKSKKKQEAQMMTLHSFSQWKNESSLQNDLEVLNSSLNSVNEIIELIQSQISSNSYSLEEAVHAHEELNKIKQGFTT
ncbi:unnamed protein product [Blepharisma stoltei]|uniref:Rab-GAP TBC domain-containing protein n=1 Tax=Blepharisma stoltei TaxID=1481888 RepID=A0AAU9J645_9CILI|nr:unnamed protein product [Blepharisma stoltei]